MGRCLPNLNCQKETSSTLIYNSIIAKNCLKSVTTLKSHTHFGGHVYNYNKIAMLPF